MVADSQRRNNFIRPTPRLNIELISDQPPRQIPRPLAVFFASHELGGRRPISRRNRLAHWAGSGRSASPDLWPFCFTKSDHLFSVRIPTKAMVVNCLLLLRMANMNDRFWSLCE